MSFQLGRFSRESRSQCLRMRTLTFLKRSNTFLISSEMLVIGISERSSMLRLSVSLSRRVLIFSKALILVYMNEYNRE